MYSGSFFRALQAIYPGHNWDSQKFRIPTVSSGYWSDINNQKKFLENVGAQLNVRTLNDWGNVTLSQIMEHGGHGLLKQYSGSLFQALQSIYPRHNWNLRHFPNVAKKHKLVRPPNPI